MLTKWKLFNFKAVQQEIDLKFKPLTIFAGANSSGKSTVLQSILLISQTISSKVGNRPVVLNGDLVRLGQFDDLKNNGSEADQITVGWELMPSDRPQFSGTGVALPANARFIVEEESMIRSVTAEFSFDASSGPHDSTVLQLQPAFNTLEFAATVREQDGSNLFSSLTVRRKLPAEAIAAQQLLSPDAPQSHRDGVQLNVFFDDRTEEKRLEALQSHEIMGCLLMHFLPWRLLASFNVAQLRGEAILRALSGDLSFQSMRISYLDIADEPLPRPIIDLVNEHFRNLPHPILATASDAEVTDETEITLRELNSRMRRVASTVRRQIRDSLAEIEADIRALVSAEDSSEVRWRSIALPPVIQTGARYTAGWFANHVKYLGPLRDEPKPIYPLVANVDPMDVGLRGEHTAAVFHLHRERLVQFIPSENFKEAAVVTKLVRRTLRFAVLNWLKYLGVAAVVDTEDKGKLGHELKVRVDETDIPHDLTHVGVGVSQVLPIVVSCLLAEPDTLLIFEQPELHLHPKVQTLLGDFFLSMALLGKQCVLETHSEYLISRLRFRAAAAEQNQLGDTLQIYFVEKPEKSATFRSVVVNEYGAISDWPDGFFDQSQREAEEILKAGFAKKQKQRLKQ